MYCKGGPPGPSLFVYHASERELVIIGDMYTR